MHGSYVVVFAYDEKGHRTLGHLTLTLNSLTNSEGPKNGKEIFDGTGKEGEIEFTIENGEVTSTGWWKMDILFPSQDQWKIAAFLTKKLRFLKNFQDLDFIRKFGFSFEIRGFSMFY